MALGIFKTVREVPVKYFEALKLIADGVVVPKDPDSIGKFYRDVYVLKEAD